MEGRDNLARVLGRAAARGEIRLSLSPLRRRWMADDKRYGPGHAVSTNTDFVACWSRGRLWGNAQSGAHPCTDASHLSVSASSFRRSNATLKQAQAGSAPVGAGALANDVAVVHLSRLKRAAFLSRLDLSSLRHAVRTAHSFALTAQGVWLPEALCEDNTTWRNRYGIGCAGYEAEGHCVAGAFAIGHAWSGGEGFQFPERHCCACGRPPAGARRSRRSPTPQHSPAPQHAWASGLLHQSEHVSVPSAALATHLAQLEARDAAARCTLSTKRAAKKGGTGCARLVAAAADAPAHLPCVAASSSGHARVAASALGTNICGDNVQARRTRGMRSQTGEV